MLIDKDRNSDSASNAVGRETVMLNKPARSAKSKQQV